MKKVTSNTVKQFADHMEKKYKARIIDKNSPLIKIIETALELMGVDAVEGSVKKWLRKWSISLKRVVYLCFTPGGRKYSLNQQVGIIVHEFAHVRRQKKDRKYFIRYILRTSYRCKYEVEAFKAQMEILWMLGVHLSPEQCLKSLRAYMLTKADRRVALKQLKIYDKYVQRGLMAQAVSKEARSWWKS